MELRQSRLPNRTKNVGWPVLSTGKGWLRQGQVKRYAEAIKHLMRTRKGSLYHDPDYGTTLHHWRAQPISEETEELLSDELTRQIEAAIPGVRVHGIELGTAVLDDEERVAVQVTWSVPELDQIQMQLYPPSSFGKQQLIVPV